VISHLTRRSYSHSERRTFQFLDFLPFSTLLPLLLILASWYPKHQPGLRITLLYCGSLISNAFGPLIAVRFPLFPSSFLSPPLTLFRSFVQAGILGNMEGILGHPAWRWYVHLDPLFFRSELTLPSLSGSSTSRVRSRCSSVSLPYSSCQICPSMPAVSARRSASWQCSVWCVFLFRPFFLVLSLSFGFRMLIKGLEFNRFPCGFRYVL
jgi:hypothetical protein